MSTEILVVASRWERLKEVLYEAMQLSPEARGPFLDQACGDDKDLRAEVDSLLHGESKVQSDFGCSACSAKVAWARCGWLSKVRRWCVRLR